MGLLSGYNTGRTLEVLFMFLAFIMIAIPNFSAMAIVLIVLTLISFAIQKRVSFKINGSGILFITLFLVYFTGCLLAEDKATAFKNLEYKLSFIILPFALSFYPNEGEIRLNRIVLSAISGSVFVMIYGIINSLNCFSNSGEFMCFQTTSVSPVHHPTYFVVYLVFLNVTGWLGWRGKWKGFRLYWILPYTAVVIVFHFLSLSLAGILFLLIVLSVSALVLIYKNLGKMATLVTVVVIPFVLYLSVNYIPRIEGEWNGAKWYFDKYLQDPEAFVESRPETMSGSEERLVMWTVAWQQLWNQPLGSGTGSAENVLAERLLPLCQEKLAEKHLNPHNQYLQTGVEIGVFGLLIIFGLIVFTSFYAIKHRNWLLLLLIGNLAFNCLFESMLQRQSGIVFYTFWVCLLVSNYHFKQLKTVIDVK